MRTLLFSAFLLISYFTLDAQGIETMDNLCSTTGCPVQNSQYSTRTWVGQDGSTWTATDSRSDQTINGKSILIRDTNDGTITSGLLSGGVSSITMTTDRIFNGGSGTLDIKVNGNQVGTIPFGTNAETTTIPGLSIEGDFILTIENNDISGEQRVAVDDITWTSYVAPLPVALTAFNAKLTNSGAMLEWTTASEENNDYFAVEMSRDAARFSESAKINGNGTTESLETYTYEYSNLTPGTYYFRLRQVDFDGQYSYSDVVSLTVDGDRDFLMASNTVTDFIAIDVTNPRPARVLNLAGAVVAEFALTAGRNNLDVSGLAQGMYILSDGINAKRFVK